MKNFKKIKALLNNSSKINAINLNFAQKLDFYILNISVRAQKIDGSILKIFEIVIGYFQIKDKTNMSRFF